MEQAVAPAGDGAGGDGGGGGKPFRARKRPRPAEGGGTTQQERQQQHQAPSEGSSSSSSKKKKKKKKEKKRRLKEKRKRRGGDDGGQPTEPGASASVAAAAVPPPPAPAAAAPAPGAGKSKRKGKKRTRVEQLPEGEPPSQESKKVKRSGAAAAAAGLPKYPFPADYCDHFETPLQAYQDVAPCLAQLARLLAGGDEGRRDVDPRASFTIYDPYYCQGRVVRLLGSLGFPKVINRMADFYADVAAKRVPPHDCLVTNPPYSEDHKERILRFCLQSGRPWLLLMPSYVANKAYYLDAVSSLPDGGAPFYLVPSQKYEYDHPEGTGHASSPFFSLWFVHVPHGKARRALLPWLHARARESGGRWRVVESVEGLRSAGAAPAWKRLSNKRRKKLKMKQQQQQEVGGAVRAR